MKRGIRTHTQFIETLETYEDMQKVLEWLENQADKRSLMIKDYMERELKLKSLLIVV